LLASFVLTFGALAQHGGSLHAAGLSTRNIVDQVDDLAGSQIHVLYVLPSDGLDEQLDINGAIARSVGTFQYWLRGQTNGRELRVDTRSGNLDITFVRLNRTDAVMQAFNAFVRDEIESELTSRGFIQPGKIYLAYYGGGSNFACGGAPWPPALNGQLSALYLKGTPPSAPPCATNVLGGSTTVPAYWEFAGLHEVLHSLGIVPGCAPNHTLSGHSSDSPQDLMYAGAQPWTPSVLDVGRDDYYGHGNGTCLDLATSPFLAQPLAGGDPSGLAYFSSDAEAGASGITVDPPWAITTEQARSGTHGWSDSPGGSYAPNTNASLYLPAIDLSAATAPQLRFWQRRNLASDGVDSANVWVTTNGGLSYTHLQAFSGSNVAWSESTIDLTAYAGQPAVQITFQVYSNASTTADGWYIDDISITDASIATNGSFGSGMTGWQIFATPDNSYIVNTITSGVFEFYRVTPPPGQSGSAVVLQNTQKPLAAGAALLARFDIGNSSSARKRISVLIHDGDFLDLSVCTFWLPPNLPLTTYSMRTHSTQAWTNASISFYAATDGSNGGNYRLDNVVLQYAPSQSTLRTDCVDPLSPSAFGGPVQSELLSNRDFSTGTTAGWTTFGQLVSQVSNSVFEFYRPLATPDPAGVILQPTGFPLSTGDVLAAQFDLGNSSGVRKRVTVLLHDLSFSDLSACTFWLAPGQPLQTYQMRAYTTMSWTNATLSVYAATIGNESWILLDNASLRKAVGGATAGTNCVEPGG